MNQMNPESLEPQFHEVLAKIQKAGQDAYSQVNAALVNLYWHIGEYIAHKVNNAEWGKKIVAELAVYIKDKAPEAKGFNDKNLWRMKQFYVTYQQDEKLATLWRQLSRVGCAMRTIVLSVGTQRANDKWLWNVSQQ